MKYSKTDRWERWLANVFPRRCVLCGALLAQDAADAALCVQCVPKATRLQHLPPRLPETEHDFTDLQGAAGAYYYSAEVRAAVLLCKRGGQLWRAREMADLMAIHIWGAEPAAAPGQRPTAQIIPGMPRYHCIVPVPPRRALPGLPGLPMLLARRLGAILQLPVEPLLRPTRQLKEQKTLNRLERLQNVQGAYAVRKGADCEGKRVLLVDDLITTGATVSACGAALLQAGAEDVFAVCVAADELLPTAQRTPTEDPA